MTPEEFVKAFHLERALLIENAFSANNGSLVSAQISSLNLDQDQKAKLKNVIESILTDAFYTILLGIDGSTSIGHQQVAYRLFDEDNNELSGGEIEAFAYEYFYNKKVGE